MRKRFFRGIRIELECGHSELLNTSRFRVQQSLKSLLVGDAVRKGVFCHACEARCQPVRVLGVERLT